MSKVEMIIEVSPFEKQAIKDAAKAERIGLAQFIINKTIGAKIRPISKPKRKRRRISE